MTKDFCDNWKDRQRVGSFKKKKAFKKFKELLLNKFKILW